MAISKVLVVVLLQSNLQLMPFFAGVIYLSKGQNVHVVRSMC